MDLLMTRYNADSGVGKWESIDTFDPMSTL